MKLDKVRFATLIGYLSRATGQTFAVSEIVEIDDIIDIAIPEVSQGRADVEQLDRLMFLMAQGTQKIEAIKVHRAMTGYGLKESKDAVEKHWHSSTEAQLLARVRQALGTTADGDDLVQAARNAYRNSEELASQHNFEKDDATLGDILGTALKR